jgi:hypothetical protein
MLGRMNSSELDCVKSKKYEQQGRKTISKFFSAASVDDFLPTPPAVKDRRLAR